MIAFPLLLLVVILQSAVVSRISLLAGYADLMLVVLAAWALQADSSVAWLWAVFGGILVAFVTKLPWPVVVIGYLSLVLLAQFFRWRVWQAPLLAMFSVTFLGTLVTNFLAFGVLSLSGNPISASDAFGLIVLSSLLLNLLLAIPVFAFMRDLANWVSPSKEIE